MLNYCKKIKLHIYLPTFNFLFMLFVMFTTLGYLNGSLVGYAIGYMLVLPVIIPIFCYFIAKIFKSDISERIKSGIIILSVIMLIVYLNQIFVIGEL